MLKLKTEVVRLEIEKLGYSATQFAKKYGFPQTSLASWLTGARNPKRGTIMRLAEIFGCEPIHIAGVEIPYDAKKVEKQEAHLAELRSYWIYLTEDQRKRLIDLVKAIANTIIEQEDQQETKK